MPTWLAGNSRRLPFAIVTRTTGLSVASGGVAEREHNGRNGDRDPTSNVLDLVAAEGRRQDDLRIAEGRRQDDLAEIREKHGRELDLQRERAANAARSEEASRINQLLAASTSNVALALEKQSAQALAQDRRIAVLEQNQYQSGGRDLQRGQERQINQWTVGLIVGVAVVAAEVALRLSGH